MSFIENWLIFELLFWFGICTTWSGVGLIGPDGFKSGVDTTLGITGGTTPFVANVLVTGIVEGCGFISVVVGFTSGLITGVFTS